MKDDKVGSILTGLVIIAVIVAIVYLFWKQGRPSSSPATVAPTITAPPASGSNSGGSGSNTTQQATGSSQQKTFTVPVIPTYTPVQLQSLSPTPTRVAPRNRAIISPTASQRP